MSGPSRNECNVLTLTPLNLDIQSGCTESAYSTGYVNISISGGTSPYNIIWSEYNYSTPPSNGVFINSYSQSGLSNGNYTGVISDFYNDFTETIDLNFDCPLECWFYKFTFLVISGYNNNDIYFTFQNSGTYINGYPSFVDQCQGIVIFFDNSIGRWVLQISNIIYYGPTGTSPIGNWSLNNITIAESYCGDVNYCVNLCTTTGCFNLNTQKIGSSDRYIVGDLTAGPDFLEISFSASTNNWVMTRQNMSFIVAYQSGSTGTPPLGVWSNIVSPDIISLEINENVCPNEVYCQCFNFTSVTNNNDITYLNCNYEWVSGVTLNSGQTLSNFCVLTTPQFAAGKVFGNQQPVAFYSSSYDLSATTCNTTCT